jgi:hypothetical protein
MRPTFCWKRRSSLFEFGNGLADGTFFEDLLLVGDTHEEGSGAEAVNLSGDAFGVIINAGKGIIGEKRPALVARELDVVVDVGNGLGKVEGREMEGGGEALEERLVRRHAQGAAQLRLANEEESAEGLGVHVGREKQAELLEGGVREKLSLVEDEEGGAVLVEEQVFEGGADAGDHFGFGEQGFITEGGQEFAVKAGDAEEGIGKVDDKIAIGVEGGGKAADSSGLAAAGFASNETEAAIFGKISEAGAEFGLAIGGEKVVRGDIPGKGDALEAVELLEHQGFSWGSLAN